MSDNVLQHSVVHEFAILYSDRIIQRDKRWSDGKLRFYELNNKIEILSEDSILLTSDFFETRNKGDILKTKLYEGNQFKLSNNKFLIEVVEKLSVYERDVSKSFRSALGNAETKPDISIKVKYEKNSDKFNSMENTMKGLGLKRKAVGLPRIKKENGNKILQSEHRRQMNYGFSEVKTPAIKQEPHEEFSNVSTKVKLEVTPSMEEKIGITYAQSPGKYFEYKTTPKIKEESLFITEKLRRIPPRSTSIFKYLNKGSQNTVVDSYHSSSGPLNHLPVTVKYEKIKSCKNLYNCDVIYDLSDFEEDENFIEMLHKRSKLPLDNQLH